MAGQACMGGHASQGDMHGMGACVADTMRYGQRASGTHPTGMYSCYDLFLQGLRGRGGRDLQWPLGSPLDLLLDGQCLALVK